MSEKTEQPTPKRLEDARKKGQIPRSRLLTSAAVTFGALLGVLSSYKDTALAMKDWMETSWTQNHSFQAAKAIDESLDLLFRGALPILLGAFGSALLVTVASTGIKWNFGELGVKLERLSPIDGIKRIFTLKIFINLFKAVIVTAVIVWLFWDTTTDEARGAFRTITVDGQLAMSLLMPKVLSWLLTACSVMLIS